MPTQWTSKDMAGFAEGMTLAGKPLQPAVLRETGWKVGQCFGPDDDPDRMTESVGTPASILDSDPDARRQQVKIQEIYREGDEQFAYVAEGVLTEAECAELIAKTNDKGYTPALLNIGGGHQQLLPEARDGHRVMSDMKPLAEWLATVMRDCFPRKLQGPFGELDEEYDYHGFNERMRFLCYTPGQSFPPHHDGMYRRPEGHPCAGDISKVTVMVYLHDVDPECGGATTLFLGPPGSGLQREVQPKAGSAFLFTQNILHEGTLVTKGLKYTIRTEAMYGLPRSA